MINHIILTAAPKRKKIGGFKPPNELGVVNAGLRGQALGEIGSQLLTPTLIKAARALLGYDQATLAAKTGISTKTIGLIETMEISANRSRDAAASWKN